MGTNVVGNAPQFEYGAGPTTVTLGSKLFNITYRSARTRHVMESDDLTLREIITVGSAIKEIVATVAYHDAPDELQDMIDFGLDGGVLTYSPDGGTTEFFCELIDASDITPFQRREGFAEYQVRLTLRATASTVDFSGLADMP